MATPTSNCGTGPRPSCAPTRGASATWPDRWTSTSRPGRRSATGVRGRREVREGRRDDGPVPRRGGVSERLLGGDCGGPPHQGPARTVRRRASAVHGRQRRGADPAVAPRGRGAVRRDRPGAAAAVPGGRSPHGGGGTAVARRRPPPAPGAWRSDRVGAGDPADGIRLGALGLVSGRPLPGTPRSPRRARPYRRPAAARGPPVARGRGGRAGPTVRPGDGGGPVGEARRGADGPAAGTGRPRPVVVVSAAGSRPVGRGLGPTARRRPPRGSGPTRGGPGGLPPTRPWRGRSGRRGAACPRGGPGSSP